MNTPTLPVILTTNDQNYNITYDLVLSKRPRTERKRRCKIVRRARVLGYSSLKRKTTNGPAAGVAVHEKHPPHADHKTTDTTFSCCNKTTLKKRELKGSKLCWQCVERINKRQTERERDRERAFKTQKSFCLCADRNTTTHANHHSPTSSQYMPMAAVCDCTPFGRSSFSSFLTSLS